MLQSGSLMLQSAYLPALSLTNVHASPLCVSAYMGLTVQTSSCGSMRVVTQGLHLRRITIRGGTC